MNANIEPLAGAAPGKEGGLVPQVGTQAFIKRLDELKRTYILCKLVYQDRLKRLGEVMRPWDEKLERGEISEDEYIKMEIGSEEEAAVDVAYKLMKRAGDELIAFAKPALLSQAKTEDDRRALEMVFNAPYATIREQVIDVILRWSGE
jgi:hypothetical protein